VLVARSRRRFALPRMAGTGRAGGQGNAGAVILRRLLPGVVRRRVKRRRGLRGSRSTGGAVISRAAERDPGAGGRRIHREDLRRRHRRLRRGGRDARKDSSMSIRPPCRRRRGKSSTAASRPPRSTTRCAYSRTAQADSLIRAFPASRPAPKARRRRVRTTSFCGKRASSARR
jgi:hypothetical protein